MSTTRWILWFGVAPLTPPTQVISSASSMLSVGTCSRKELLGVILALLFNSADQHSLGHYLDADDALAKIAIATTE
jgi:hypothetical protein